MEIQYFLNLLKALSIDVKGKYIDYVNSWGANLLGHADSRIIKAVKEQVDLGLSFGAPCELETMCARLLKFGTQRRKSEVCKFWH